MKLTMYKARGARRAGFTMIEAALSLMLVVLVSGTLVTAMENMRSLATANNNRVGLEMMADEALTEIVDDLRSSGVISQGGRTYPYVFDAGVPDDPDFAGHAHAPAADGAEAGDSDFGPDREVVFLRPLDADGDRRPDLDAEGALLWDAVEFSYVVVTRPDGVNTLERRQDAAAPTIVGRYVERLVVDTAQSSGFQIPLGTVRVRMFFRQLDTNGNLMRTSREAVVRLRNGEGL